jgi:hypothetical protein
MLEELARLWQLARCNEEQAAAPAPPAPTPDDGHTADPAPAAAALDLSYITDSILVAGRPWSHRTERVLAIVGEGEGRLPCLPCGLG